MADHIRDEDCTLGWDDCCVACGVHHADPCERCGGRGFHREACPESDATCEVCEERDGTLCPVCRTVLCDSCAATSEHGDLHDQRAVEGA